MINKLRNWKLRILHLMTTVDKNYELLKEIKSSIRKQDDETKQIENQIEIQKNLFIKEIQDLRNEIKTISSYVTTTKALSKEILWSEIFNNTITDSHWLKDRRFSPGRWAVGYQYLYAVYRILNEAKPKTILELGLGQSTKMLSQYVLASPNTEHLVVEHDKKWIEFFSNEFKLPKNSYVIQLELENSKFKEDNEVLSYKDFAKVLENRKFDFISIDAPFGGNAKIYARIDVLRILPQCLNDNFIIVIDDYNRKGEKNMVIEMEKVLQENGIKYNKGVYAGEKECLVIVSPNNKFLTSM